MQLTRDVWTCLLFREDFREDFHEDFCESIELGPCTVEELRKGLYILLGRSQAGPGRTPKQKQEEIH